MEDLVMLATDWDPSVDPTGMWMSEKLDGILALWDGRRFISRAGNDFSAPDWFTRHMPQERLLGELYVGRGKFNDTLSVIRRARPRPVEWARVTYRVFDMPDAVGSFETRLYAACQTILSMQLMWRGDTDRPGFAPRDLPILPIHQETCPAREAFDRFHGAIVGRGGEGTMLRRPGSLYRVGRSPDLLRRKDWFQEEAVVVGHNQNPVGFRSLRCTLVSEPRFEFDVAAGLTAAQVASPPGVGSVVTVRYKSRTDRNTLREPSFIAVRDYE